ncbi:MAG: flavin reductase [Clostridia bacterium]|nr:flavin reductase [Clostridia bacterium]
MFMERHINPGELNENTFSLIGKDWFLITAGDKKQCNTMTASYGSFGILFGKPVAQIYVRPERYTYDFLEEQNGFSLSFFSEEYRDQLKYCGKASGKDEDKIKRCGFTTHFKEDGIPYFREARLTVICKKIYAQDLNAELLNDATVRQAVYGSGGVHRMYVGEITDLFYQE